MRTTTTRRGNHASLPARAVAILSALILIATLAPSAPAQTEIAFTAYPGTVTQVTAAAPVPGRPNHMFVLTRFGTVRLLDLGTGQYAATPVFTFSTDGGNGATGLAFHPQFASNGYFFIQRGIGVARVRMNGDPLTSTTVDPASLSTVIRINGLSGQHSGGWIGFDPFDTEGILWYSTGDSFNSANGQRTDNLFGRILRIDIDGPDNIVGNADDDAYPADINKNFSIPRDNPFLGEHPGLDEIWAYGLRNPYRCAFDPLLGDLWIGDVGEGRREEISFQPFHHVGLLPGMEGYTGGRNYGWDIWEGTVCRRGTTLCNATPQTAPIAEYPLGGSQPFAPFFIPAGSAVIAGGVYRGCRIPELRGWFIFGDAGGVGGQPDFIWALKLEDGVAVAARQLIRTAPSTVYGFAQDPSGEMYLCGANGFFRIEPLSTAGRDTNNNGTLDSCEPGCGADFDQSGTLDGDDLADFINAFFAAPPPASADWNNDGGLNADDLADYINAYFGCAG